MVISSDDSPTFMIPKFFKQGKKLIKNQGDGTLVEVEWALDFDLWIVARAKGAVEEEKNKYFCCSLVTWGMEAKIPFPFKTKKLKYTAFLGKDLPENILKVQKKFAKDLTIDTVQITNGEYEITTPKKWGDMIVDGSSPTVVDGELYNKLINSGCKYIELQ